MALTRDRTHDTLRSTTADTDAPPRRGLRGRLSPRMLLIGIGSGFVAILCCVSPVVLVLLGIASATTAISLGDTLYYQYGWYFRGAGLLTAGVAVYLYLRGRRMCSLSGIRGQKLNLALLVLSGGAAYAALFWLTRYLGIWFG